jgi:hypothetical protein
MTDPAGLPDDDVSIDELREAVEHLHGGPARFVEAVEVDERFQGKPVWQGTVKVLALDKHPSGATRAYAWSVRTEGTRTRARSPRCRGQPERTTRALRLRRGRCPPCGGFDLAAQRARGATTSSRPRAGTGPRRDPPVAEARRARRGPSTRPMPCTSPREARPVPSRRLRAPFATRRARPSCGARGATRCS